MNLENLEPSEKELSRRSFLKWAIVSLGSVIAGVLGSAGAGYFLSPLFRRKDERWVDLGDAKDFVIGLPTKVDFAERKRDAWITSERKSSVWILTTDGKNFTAFDPRCTHLGCPYSWSAQQKKFMCPCHSAVFERDGSVVSGPAPRSLDKYSTKTADGRLWVLPKSLGEHA